MLLLSLSLCLLLFLLLLCDVVVDVLVSVSFCSCCFVRCSAPLHIEVFIQYCPACMTTHIIERASRSYVRQVPARSFLCDVNAFWAPQAQIRVKRPASLYPFLCDVIALWPLRGTSSVWCFLFEGLFCVVFYSVLALRLKLWSSLFFVLFCLLGRCRFGGFLCLSWGHLGVMLGLTRTSRRSIFVRRHRTLSTLSFELLVGLSLSTCWPFSCRSPFLCDVIAL